SWLASRAAMLHRACHAPRSLKSAGLSHSRAPAWPGAGGLAGHLAGPRVRRRPRGAHRRRAPCRPATGRGRLPRSVEAGTGTGAETGAETGTETEAGAGTEAETGTETDTGAEA